MTILQVLILFNIFFKYIILKQVISNCSAGGFLGPLSWVMNQILQATLKFIKSAHILIKDAILNQHETSWIGLNTEF